MGSYWYCSSGIYSNQAVQAVVYPSCIHHGWLHRLRDFSGIVYGRTIFNDFVREQLLPRMSPFVPGGHELSVIVLDNARIHRNQELRQMCEAVGVKLEFLPPYSPDFNPIEASFHGMKSIAP
jgi:hypothetical protein